MTICFNLTLRTANYCENMSTFTSCHFNIKDGIDFFFIFFYEMKQTLYWVYYPNIINNTEIYNVRGQNWDRSWVPGCKFTGTVLNSCCIHYWWSLRYSVDISLNHLVLSISLFIRTANNYNEPVLFILLSIYSVFYIWLFQHSNVHCFVKN